MSASGPGSDAMELRVAVPFPLVLRVVAALVRGDDEQKQVGDELLEHVPLVLLAGPPAGEQ